MTEAAFHSTAHPAVLLVEDEPRYRDMLIEAVGGMGFQARGVSSGEQALRAMAQHPYGIVILDLNLPGIGGMELLETLRRDYPNAQIIILTGFGSLEAAKKAMRCDVVDFITKPCQLDELELSLSRAHSRRRQATAPTSAARPASLNDKTSSLEEIERSHILSSMQRNQGNRRAVANELGISLRTLYNRLRDYKESKALAAPAKRNPMPGSSHER